MASEAQEEKKISVGEGLPGGEGGGEEVKEKGGMDMEVGEEVKEKKAAGVGGNEVVGKRKRGRKPKGETAEKKVMKKRSAVPGKEAKPVERPTRERKSVERLSALTPQKPVATKAVSIQQGSGTKLKDIPNVFFKISKRKADENLQRLHKILFGKKAKALYLKRNIYQFSGFVWTENEEKQRAKMKEKLDKCVKDKLLEFCDVLDIPVSKATTKKEEISAKLLEFLESPYVTRDVMLAEKEQGGKKRKRRTKEISEAILEGHSDGEIEKRRRRHEAGEMKKGHKLSAMTEEGDEDGGSADSKGDASNEEQDEGDESQKEAAGEKSEADDEEDEQERVVRKRVSDQKQMRKSAISKVREKTLTVKIGSPAKSARSLSKSPSKKATVAAEGETRVPIESKKGSPKERTRRGSKASTKEKATYVKKTSAKSTKGSSSAAVDINDSERPATSKAKGDKNKIQNNKPSTDNKKGRRKAESASTISAKKRGKGKASGKAEAEPTTEDLRAVVGDILQEVDFNTATLADILKQLGSHFSMDLMHRKAEVKSIIEEVINSMSDGENDGEDEEEDNAESQEEDDAGESDKDGDS